MSDSPGVTPVRRVAALPQSAAAVAVAVLAPVASQRSLSHPSRSRGPEAATTHIAAGGSARAAAAPMPGTSSSRPGHGRRRRRSRSSCTATASTPASTRCTSSSGTRCAAASSSTRAGRPHRDAVPRALRHRAVHEVLAARIRGAIAYLRARPKRRLQPDLKRTSYFGFSFGGIITANLTDRYQKAGPAEAARHLARGPARRGPRRVRRARGGRLAARDPVVREAQVPLERRGRHLRAQPRRRQLQRDLPEARAHPKRNKDLVLTRPDAHGTPALTAPHGCAPPRRDSPTPTTGTSAGNPGTPCAAAPTGGPTANMLGNTRQHRSNGKWSDGVPIAPLKIQDVAPIRP